MKKCVSEEKKTKMLCKHECRKSKIYSKKKPLLADENLLLARQITNRMEMYTFFIYEKKLLLKKYERDEFIWIMMWCHDDAFDLQLFFFRSKKRRKF